MDFDTMIALATLAFVAAFTPGPNNALVASSGANFGFGRTIPHILGIAFGFALMIFIVGFFLGALFEQSALLRKVLRWGGVVLLLYIAWKIATAGGLGSKDGNPRPFRFVEAAAFQWVNPKAWAMAVAITAQFVSGGQQILAALITAGIFVIAGLTSASTWALAGTALTQWINTPERLRLFNIVMALLIAGCVVLLFLD
jgi:threonine/homoserine/homoserine lactone efflux protein